ncbi:MAG: gas vesicle protein [Deltaproteobacteria bacterium]|nr:gas vesicle protein [Deltaproteobacteria bacterium]
MAAGMGKIVKNARSELNALTGLEVSSTIEVVKQDDEWRVVLEVVEKHSIPEGMDILASYETRLDLDGGMLEFRRTGMRRRIDTDWTPE